MKLQTKLVRAGAKPDPETGALAAPIHLSTTFEHSPNGVPLRGTEGHLYQRESSPTQSRLEEALAECESGKAALVFSSGLAAATAYFQSLPRGTRVYFHRDLYYALRSLVLELFPKWGLTHREIEMTRLAEIQKAAVRGPAIFWLESPGNPGLEIIDIRGVSKIISKYRGTLVVDNTFATPALQRPLSLGANIVLHSTTKYLGGHGDSMGGALVFKRKGKTFETIRSLRTLTGAVASPFNSWLILRGLRTLSCRMERHCSNAAKVAEAIKDHPAVDSVIYPGLDTHPQHILAQSQMEASGGMVTLLVKGGQRAALRIASALKLWINATSLGGTESLVEHRASIEKVPSQVPKNLLRLSVGLEHSDDIIRDLLGALDSLK